ncbi:MAG TPA: heme-binding protein [Nitrospiria bacterium]|nr:heme-binding protein [Nitrospiria bacterium]
MKRVVLLTIFSFVLIAYVLIGKIDSTWGETTTVKLTEEDIVKILDAAQKKAKEIGVGMSISVVDEGGNLLGFIRMDGAFLHSIHTSYSKAYTAASIRRPTGSFPPPVSEEISSITNGRFTNLKGGMPIMIDGKVVGAVGAGSGTGEQDEMVSRAGAEAIVQK